MLSNANNNRSICEFFHFIFDGNNTDNKQAFKLGMYGADYVWILHEIAGTPWWYESTPECDQKQLQVVAENVIVVSSYNSIVNDDISHSGLVCMNMNSISSFEYFVRLLALCNFHSL